MMKNTKNNWEEKIKEIYNKNVKSTLDDEGRLKAFLEFGNLVFEATKKECSYVPELFKEQSEKILKVSKPNL